MIQQIVRRLLWLPILLFLVTLLTLAVARYGPGDPCQVMLGQRTNPEVLARCQAQLGLDQPLVVQVTTYLWNALHGDLGESFKYRGQPVGRLIVSRLWVSIQLNAVALAAGIAIGVPLGIVAALRRNTWLDYLTVSGTILAASLPAFAIGPILAYFFAVQLRLLPPGGWDGVFSARIIMPAAVLATGPAAVFARQTRANLLEVISAEYVRVARAKGLPEQLVILRHALRNALIPLATIFGLMLAGLVGGTFITETIFGIPGIGRLVFEVFGARDYPVIVALTLIVAVAYALANLLIDISYMFLDPRIREAGREPVAG